MADYKSMYRVLINAQMKAMEILQDAHAVAEEYVMNAKEPVNFDEVTESENV